MPAGLCLGLDKTRPEKPYLYRIELKLHTNDFEAESRINRKK